MTAKIYELENCAIMEVTSGAFKPVYDYYIKFNREGCVFEHAFGSEERFSGEDLARLVDNGYFEFAEG